MRDVISAPVFYILNKIADWTKNVVGNFCGIAESKKAPPAPFLHLWIVQDDSLCSPFGPSPQAAPLS
ncbi:hypothetical protein, partial [Kosakonia sp. YIM B13587]|uniref:hypothetical protein n=1 Tax=Kosakonia sp. YIM B13587 TaxID=3366288 RepID=UPI0036AEC774